MEFKYIQEAVCEQQEKFFHAITTATFKGEPRRSGLEAKQSLIRGSHHINPITEAVKRSLDLAMPGMLIFPPLGASKPEQTLYGANRKKARDLSLFFPQIPWRPEEISSGEHVGEKDQVGYSAMSNAVVVGVRSQNSSIGKNRDHNLECLTGEDEDLRARISSIRHGYVYLVQMSEFDSHALINNRVGFTKTKRKVIHSFVRAFNTLASRYNAVALLLVDLDSHTPRFIFDHEEFAQEYGSEYDFTQIQPKGFVDRLLYTRR